MTPAHPQPASVNQRWLDIASRRRAFSPNLPTTLVLRGVLDRDALRRALDAVVARHESLRTTMQGFGPRLARLVHEPEPVPWRTVRMTGSPASMDTLAAAAADQAVGFDTVRERPVRAVLYEFGADRFLVSIVVHHLASDGYSGTLLLDELAAVYTALVGDQTPELPDVPWQYSDFVDWQAERLGGEAGRVQRAYWEATLAGGRAFRVPPPPPGAEPADSSHVLSLGAGTGAAFARRARGLRTTVFALALCSLARALTALGELDAPDLTLTTVFANRFHEPSRATIGPIANYAYLRIPDVHAPLEILARAALGTVAGALEHQEFPVQFLPGSLLGAPHAQNLARTIVVHMDARPARVQLPGLDVRRVETGGYSPPYGVEVFIHHDTGVFDIDVSGSERGDPAFPVRLLDALRAEIVATADATPAAR